MHIRVLRQDFSEKSTIGTLLINGVFECYTLEDVDRGLRSDMPLNELLHKKVKGQTAIPSGTYKVILNFSNRFQKIMPLLLGVPGFEGIRMHPGNKHQDTEGCILPGTVKGNDKVLNSKVAYAALLAKIEDAFGRGEEITIQIG